MGSSTSSSLTFLGVWYVHPSLCMSFINFDSVVTKAVIKALRKQEVEKMCEIINREDINQQDKTV